MTRKNPIWVFESNSKDGHFTDPKSCWRRILKQANIKDLRIHDLRRTLATNLNQLGINSITIKDILGHSHNDVTPIYAKTRLQTMYETLQKREDFVLSMCDGFNGWW